MRDGKYEGNRCPRGVKFAEQERTAPKRVLTTTVRMADGRLLPVKTAVPVDRSVLSEAVSELRECTGTENWLRETGGWPEVRCGDRVASVHDGNGDIVPVIAAAELSC